MKRWGARVQIHPEGFAVSAATEPFDRLKVRPVEVQPNGVGFQQRGNVAQGFSPTRGEAFTAEPQGKLSSPLPLAPFPPASCQPVGTKLNSLAPQRLSPHKVPLGKKAWDI